MINGSFDDDLVHAWLNCVRDNGWCSLHYESPALSSQDRAEITGGGYVRRKIDFSEPVSRTIWQLDTVRFIGLNANRITHFGVWDHKKGGRLKGWGVVPGGGALIPQGGSYIFPAGQIAMSL